MSDIKIDSLKVACSCGYPERPGFIHGVKNCIPAITDDPADLEFYAEATDGTVPRALPDMTHRQPIQETGRVLMVPVNRGGGRPVPHVRGDVHAVSMARKAKTIVGRRYIVSFRSSSVDAVAVSFEAMLVMKVANAAGEEVLEFDNGVRIIDELERFRFQES